MEIIVIDSNIVFAALKSKRPSIRNKLSNPSYRFHAPKFLFVEIFKHKERLLKKAVADGEDFLEHLSVVLHYINFINEDNISTEVYITAYNLCKDVDENDVPFVALAIALDCKIWTRDLVLKNGLVAKGFDKFIEEKDL